MVLYTWSLLDIALLYFLHTTAEAPFVRYFITCVRFYNQLHATVGYIRHDYNALIVVVAISRGRTLLSNKVPTDRTLTYVRTNIKLWFLPAVTVSPIILYYSCMEGTEYRKHTIISLSLQLHIICSEP